MVGPGTREGEGEGEGRVDFDPAFNASAFTRAAALAQPEFLHSPPPRRRTHNAVPSRSGPAGGGSGTDAAPLQRTLSGATREVITSPLPRAVRANSAMGLLRTISVTSSVTGEITIDKYALRSSASHAPQLHAATSGSTPLGPVCAARSRALLVRPALYCSVK